MIDHVGPCSTSKDDGNSVIGSRLFPRYLLFISSCFVAWTAFATLLMPALLRLSHEGHAIPILSALMAGRGTTPLDAYLASWARIAWGVAFGILLIAVASLPLVLAQPSVRRRLESGGRNRLSRRRAAVLYALGLACLSIGVIALAYVHPVAYVYAITEDYWVEHGTVAAFMVATPLFLWAALLHSGWRRLGPLAFAGAAFVAGMDEISWGQRILGLDTPEFLLAQNYQGELTLHNIWFPRHMAIGVALGLFGLALPAVGRRWGVLRARLDGFAVPLVPGYLAPVFVVAASLLILAGYRPEYLKVDEVAELAVGLCILLLAADVAMRAGAERPVGTRLVLVSGSVAVAVAALLTGALVRLAPDPNGLAWRLNQFAAHELPAAGLEDQAAALYSFLERNPDYRTARTRIDYGRFLLQRGRFEEARRVLRAAMEDQLGRLAGPPEIVADARRNQLEIHHLLGRRDLARRAFQDALRVEERALRSADSPEERAWVHWSLARTLAAHGNRSAAVRYAAVACRLAQERMLRRTIRSWLNSYDPAGMQLFGCEADRGRIASTAG